MQASDILGAVEKALSSFGQNMKEATYFCLETKEGVTSDDILSNPEAFIRALRTTFGTGSKLVERTLLREINSLFTLPEEKSYSLQDALESARSKIVDYRNHRDSSQFFDSAAKIGSALDSDIDTAIPSSPTALEQNSRRKASSKYAHISVAIVRLEERRKSALTPSSEVQKKPVMVAQITHGRIIQS